MTGFYTQVLVTSRETGGFLRGRAGASFPPATAQSFVASMSRFVKFPANRVGPRRASLASLAESWSITAETFTRIGWEFMDQGESEDVAGVFIIIGRVWPIKDGDSIDVHILLVAPDDDSAIRSALNALAERGYEEAELDQIGTIVDAPDEEPHASAYQGALEGEVAIVTFAEGLDDETDPGRADDDEDDDYDPFAILKDWKPQN